MEIRVRELRAYLDANPRLEEYDAPLLVTIPAEGDVELELTSVTVARRACDGRVSESRLVLEFAASMKAEICTDRCKENVKTIEKAKTEVKRLIEFRSKNTETKDTTMQLLESLQGILDGEGE